MENIYNKSVYDRNSIVELPADYARDAGVTLYKWLGSVWRGLNKGNDLVKGLQGIRGYRLAQMYLDTLEAAAMKDRNGLPVFHRELWHPIIIRKSERNTAQENMLMMGEGDTMGPQQEGSPYPYGTTLQMGRLAEYKDYVTYPIKAGIVGMSETIVDNIINPTIAMQIGDGKDVVFRNNTIIFPKDMDPLRPGSGFDVYDVPAKDSDDPKKMDMETILWASDVLIDRNYISDHLSYALGADAPSSDLVKRILNAAWDSITEGLTPEALRTLLAAMLNIPVIQNDSEKVLSVSVEDDGTFVTTDSGVYSVSPKAKLRSCVKAGAVLKKGELLDESVRVYPFLNGVSWKFTRAIPGSYSTTPPGSVSGATGNNLFFRPNNLGILNGYRIREIVLEFNSNAASYKGEGFAKLWKYGGSSYPRGELVATSETVNWNGTAGTRIPFIFNGAVVDVDAEGTLNDGYLMVDFYDSAGNARAWRMNGFGWGRENSDCYFVYKTIGPAMTINYEHDDFVIIHKDTGFSVPLEMDVPSVVVPPEVLRVRTESGVYAMWGASTVKRSTLSPGNDANPHLYFDVGGTDTDVAAFWDGVWKDAERRGVSMEKIVGREGDKVSPAAFFLRHMVGANTLFVVVDRSQVDDTSMMRDPMFFDMLSSVVPSAIRLFLVEHRPIEGEDSAEMAAAAENESLFAALAAPQDSINVGSVVGNRELEPSCGESVTIRFVRLPPAKTRGKKEEG